MGELIQLINVAASKKPAMGDECNHCGWCCLTEVCPVGQEITGKSIGPCRLLASDDSLGLHYCSLALNIEDIKQDLGIGSGCCAQTQHEAIAALGLDSK